MQKQNLKATSEVKEKKEVMNEKYIRFDWAMKRMLRDKANFDVLEGLLTVLFEEQVKIEELLESESNQENSDDKYNRVDIKAKNSKDEIILVEIQLNRDYNFLKRAVYGVAKTISEHMSISKKYSNVKKVYSVNIVYFNLGEGEDYLYHGQALLKGVFKHDMLQIRERDGNALKLTTPKDVFPEYYVIRLNEFNDLARTPLEEWLDYLKNGRIKDDTKVPGLQAAREKLQYIQMTVGEQRAYLAHMEAMMSLDSVIDSAKFDGRMEGREEGREEERQKHLEEKLANAKKMKDDGLPVELIIKYTGLTAEEIRNA